MFLDDHQDKYCLKFQPQEQSVTKNWPKRELILLVHYVHKSWLACIKTVWDQNKLHVSENKLQMRQHYWSVAMFKWTCSKMHLHPHWWSGWERSGRCGSRSVPPLTTGWRNTPTPPAQWTRVKRTATNVFCLTHGHWSNSGWRQNGRQLCDTVKANDGQ